MKWTTLGFNQQHCVKYGLKTDDLFILRWLADFEPKMSKASINEKEFFWVNYQAVLEDLPILNVKLRALEYKFERLCNIGILEHKTIRKGGTYAYYRFTSKYFELLEPVKEKQLNAEEYVKKCSKGMQKIAEQNNTSTKNNQSIITKNNDDINFTNEQEQLEKDFNLLWEQYPKKTKKQSAYKEYVLALQKYRNKDYKDANINRMFWYAIIKYNKQVEEEQRETKFIKNGDNFFKEIDDYIDINDITRR